MPGDPEASAEPARVYGEGRTGVKQASHAETGRKARKILGFAGNPRRCDDELAALRPNGSGAPDSMLPMRSRIGADGRQPSPESTMRRWSCLIFVLLMLMGCVTRPPAPPPLTPAEARAAWAKSIAVAIGEWEKFGGQIVHLRRDAEGHDYVAIEPVRSWEDSTVAYDPLIAYWAAVGEDPASFASWQACYSGWERKCPWQLPWSAAFISYVMQQAGFGPADFTSSAEHWEYVKAAIHRAERPGAIFLPESPARYAPQPGDLICKTRAGAKPPAFEPLLEDPDRFGGSLPMHCDLVIANHGSALAPDGLIEAIGGNVLNSVSKSLFPAHEGLIEPGRSGSWFVILRNAYGEGVPVS